MPDANTAFIVLASVQGALTVVLAGSTYYYARKTRDIAEATRQQAKASVKMAEEMREQRLAEDRPWLLIDIPRAESHRSFGSAL